MCNCKVCGRPLKDPVSISLEVGPVCRLTVKNTNSRDKTMDIFGGADFEYDLINGVLVIYDLDQGGQSVTNGICDVLGQISKEVKITDDMPIIYRDSQKIFDGISHKEGSFLSFYSVNETLLDKALKKVKRKLTH